MLQVGVLRWLSYHMLVPQLDEIERMDEEREK